MNKKTLNMFRISAVAASVAIGINAYAAQTISAVSAFDIANYPLYATGVSQPSLVMLLIGRDQSMYQEVYNDMTDLDEDGMIDGMFNPAVTYDGLFEPNLCYKYDSSALSPMSDSYASGHYKISSVAESDNPVSSYKNQNSIVYYCHGDEWSGNFLNYVTMSRMDMVKRILMGGERIGTQSGNQLGDTIKTWRNGDKSPILIRQWIPRDAHTWAKIFNKKDQNEKNRCPLQGGCTIDKWTPISGKKAGAIFANTGRYMYYITFGENQKLENEKDNRCGDNCLIGSLDAYADAIIKGHDDAAAYDGSHIYPWSWVARETNKGITVVSDSKTKLNQPANTGDKELNVGVTTHRVAVESCKPLIDGSGNTVINQTRCKKYGNGLYNTVGLIQQNSEPGKEKAYFGLITADWQRKNGNSEAVLRAKIKNLNEEKSYGIDSQTGEFTYQSVLGAINSLSLAKETVGSSGGGTDQHYSDCHGKWTDGLARVTASDSPRVCSDWGNPLAPLIATSRNYFEGKSSSYSISGSEEVTRKISYGNNLKANLPVIQTNSSPYSESNGFLECQHPINLILMDESVTFDYKFVGNNLSELLDQGADIIDKGESIKGNSYVLGETEVANDDEEGSDAYWATYATAKKVSSLGSVRGVSVSEPHLEGSLKGAMLAAAYYANPITVDGKEFPSIQNISVAMASNLPKFEIYTINGNKALFVPLCKMPRDSGKTNISCALLDIFYIGSDYSVINGENRLTSVTFRVTYEDNEAGSDWDMDAQATYSVSADPNDHDKLNVTLWGNYTDSHAGEILGYTIIGTDGYKAHKFYRTNIDDPSSRVIKDVDDKERTVFLDIAKAEDGYPTHHYKSTNPIYDRNSDDSPVLITQIGSKAKPHTWDDSKYQCWVEDWNPDEERVMIYPNTTYDGGKQWKPGEKSKSKGTSRYSGAIGYDLPLVNGTQDKVYCQSLVTRSFKVTSSSSAKFMPSPLELTAKYGFRKSDLSNYFYVTNASRLTAQLTAAMNMITDSTAMSNSAVAFSSVDTSNGKALIQANFEAQYWTGDVVKTYYTETAGTNKVSKSCDQLGCWSAAKVITAQAQSPGRNVYLSSADGKLYPLTADTIKSGLFPRLTEGLEAAFDGLSSCSEDDKDRFYQAYVDYIVKADDSHEVKIDVDNTIQEGQESKAITQTCSIATVGFKERHGNVLGAIIHSTPQVTVIGGKKFVIFGANDGLIHILEENTGKELLAVMPYVAQYIAPLSAKPGNNVHYILDGEINIPTVQIAGSNTDRRVAYGSLGTSYAGLYALDISSLADTGTDVASGVKMLWELSKFENNGIIKAAPDLGGFTTPINLMPYKFTTGTKLLAVFGNGYNSVLRDPNPRYVDEPAKHPGRSGVFVVNAFTGKVLSGTFENDTQISNMITHNNPDSVENSFGMPYCDTDAYSRFKTVSGNSCISNGMNAVAAYDSDRDGIPNFMYTTDLYGNVYRIANSKTVNGVAQYDDIKAWTITRVHTAVGPDNKVQSITSKPSLGANSSGKPMIVFGTGRYLSLKDVTDISVQSLYGLTDKYHTSNPGDLILSKRCSNATRANVECLRGAIGVDGGLFKYKTKAFNAGVDPNNQYNGYRDIEVAESGDIRYDEDLYDGWAIDLVYEPGERTEVSPTILDKHAYITTLVPNTNDPCKAGAQGHMYDINITTGKFYKNAAESQVYSDHLLSKASLSYSTTAESGASTVGTGTESDPRRRDTNTFGCTTVSAWTADGVDTYKKTGPQYCPRIESWQYIYN